MARVKRGTNARKRHKKVLKQAKGFFGSRHRLFKTANTAVMRSMAHQYIGRKHRKRDMRKLWITRINAATRQNGLSYSKFMHGLKVMGVDINRKMLSEMAIHDPKAFSNLVEMAKENI
ncbi:MAG: 50S ribosomal protein L20 [Tissierellia bacterium]|nr:50S ribosomal protein L20 [Tissierellia bacterium]